MSSPTIEEITAVTAANHTECIGSKILRMNDLLYGDDRKLSRWELVKLRWERRVERVHDAWAVLKGEAYIGD